MSSIVRFSLASILLTVAVLISMGLFTPEIISFLNKETGKSLHQHQIKNQADTLLKKEIEKIESLDVESEVMNAIDSGDPRFLVYLGEGPSIPGIAPENWQKLNWKYLNTSDVIYSNSQESYYNSQWNYAERFNKLLWENIQNQNKASEGISRSSASRNPSS